MKTTSIGRSSIRWPGVSAMYSSMRFNWARLPSSASSAGLGTTPVTATTWPGVVPHVTIGAISAVVSRTIVSKCAPGSVGSVFQ